MALISKISYLLELTRSHGILRRYFVVNGFDGAITMLGLCLGFALSAPTQPSVIINACMGAAVALGMSGVSSAYVSESAERKRALEALESAMITDLTGSAHAEAARWVPWVVALVNGLAPFLISLLIITPLWMEAAGVVLPFAALYLSITVALVLVFSLGAFIGSIAKVSLLRSGMQTLLLACATAALIYWLAK